MNIRIATTAHKTVHAIGTGPAEELKTLRRSIASRAGRYGVGHRITEHGTNFGDGTVELRVIYSEK